MTTFYPDISAFQTGIDLKGVPAVCCKVTEGTGYVNPDYSRAKSNAASHNVFFFAYHFLHAGNATDQAAWCHQHAKTTPLMLDVEPVGGSHPSLMDVAEFIAAYRANGGTIHLVYLPHWYWQQIGSPSLSTLKDANLCLVSSQYTSFASGAGWAAYGGVTPVIWQYSQSNLLNGHTVDYNAYRGTLTQLKSRVRTGKLPEPKVAVNPVEGLHATPRYTQADLKWNDTPGAKSYRVIVKRGLKVVSKHETPHLSRTVTDLRAGFTYTATVLGLPAKLTDSIAGRARIKFTTKK